MSSDPQYWRDVALQKRMLAVRLKDPLAKAVMIRLSNQYSELAKQAERLTETVPKVVCLRPSFPEAARLLADE